MKITEITDNKDKILQLNVFPDVIKNRFDVLHSVVENRGGYTLYCIENNMQKTYIPVFFNNTSCELGCYMRKIDKCLFEKFVNYLFKTHKKLQVVSVLHTLTDIATLSVASHWHIELPDTIEEFDGLLSAKERQHCKYYAKKLLNEVGNISFEKINRDSISQDVVDLYLLWKKDSHKFSYEKTSYLKDFCVSNAYLLKTNNTIIAIGFDVETSKENVYFENFSYDSKYSKYSIGMILYHNIIESWINDHKKIAYLLGGNYEYKRRYNGICTMTRSGGIYRHPFIEKLCYLIGKKFNLLQLPYKKSIVKVIKHLFLLKYYKKRFKQIALKNTNL